MRSSLFLALCLLSCSAASAQQLGGPPGEGGGKQPPAPPAKSNWWKKTEQRLCKIDANIDLDGGWSHFDSSTTRPLGIEKDIPWEWNFFNSNRRGYLRNHADTGSVKACANSEVYDYWSIGSPKIGTKSHAYFSRTVNWFWDGDAQHPLLPANFIATGDINMSFKSSGSIRPDTDSLASSKSIVGHSTKIDRPFGWDFREPDVTVFGTAKARSEQDLRSISYVVGLQPTYKVIGFGVICEYSPTDQDATDHGYAVAESFLHSHRQQCIVRAGFGYTYCAFAEVSTFAKSDGGTAWSSAEASVDLHVDVSPAPGQGEQGDSLQ